MKKFPVKKKIFSEERNVSWKKLAIILSQEITSCDNNKGILKETNLLWGFDRNKLIFIKWNSWQVYQLSEKHVLQEPGTGTKQAGAELYQAQGQLG